MKRGLADPDDRSFRRASRRVEAGVVETGDDEGVGVAGLADLLDQPWNRECLVEIAFDAGRAEIGVDGADLDPGRSGSLGRGADLEGHRAGGVGIDDVDAHAVAPRFGPEIAAPEALVHAEAAAGERKQKCGATNAPGADAIELSAPPATW